jgi:DNA-binding CsgD family transcriptional regulator
MKRLTMMMGPSLSAHEYRIAVQAAVGVSNQAIGDGLGVSSRAVEHHLTSAYRKLEIHGRDQLRRALREYAARRDYAASRDRGAARTASPHHLRHRQHLL